MKLTVRLVFLSAASLSPLSSAQVTITPLTGFGDDGWVAPLEVSWLSDTAATERSIAYARTTDELYVASRNGGSRIRILNGTTGKEVITATNGVNTAGVSGGTFALSCVGVAEDGVLFACNLASPLTPGNPGTPFKIYRWDDITSPPTVAVETTAVTTGRLGDTMDVTGSGAGTRIVAGESNTAGSGARNGFAVFAPPAAGTIFTEALVTFTGNPTTAAGDFRAGITFTDAGTVIGAQGTLGFKFTRFTGTTGTLDQAKVLTNTLERPMDYIMLGGKPLLATIETNGTPNPTPATYSTVRIYDLTAPISSTPVASGRTATLYYNQGTAAGTGAVQWGKVTGNSAVLYALSTNNGIQAFTVTVAAPDPPLEFTRLTLNGSQLDATWASAPGRTYRFEVSTDLTAWTPIASGLTAAPGATTSYQWSIPAAYTGRAQVRVVTE